MKQRDAQRGSPGRDRPRWARLRRCWPPLVACVLLGCAGPGEPGRRPEPSQRGEAREAAVSEGRFRKLRAPRQEPVLDAEQRARIEQLESIGYLAGSTPAPALAGVVRHSAAETYRGLNFYVSGHGTEALLMDMDGNVLHRWHKPFAEVWPDHPRARDKPDTRFWRRAQLLANGDLVAIHEGLGILKLDKDSRLVWARPYPVHHDLQVMPTGEIYVLTREAHLVPRISPRDPLVEDFVSILEADGEERSRLSLLECFENAAPEHSWSRAYRDFWSKPARRRLAEDPADLFHTNSVEVLDGRIASRAPAFAAGNLLVSMCHLDTIAVVDPRQRRIVWSMGGFAMQHDPTITPDGGLMLFDNHWQPQRSSVILLDPVTQQVKWRYPGAASGRLYSRTCGTAQPLPNGNTLITESDNGRAIEVTPAGKVVWEFYNPHRAGADDEYIATLFELVRVEPELAAGWADGQP